MNELACETRVFKGKKVKNVNIIYASVMPMKMETKQLTAFVIQRVPSFVPSQNKKEPSHTKKKIVYDVLSLKL